MKTAVVIFLAGLALLGAGAYLLVDYWIFLSNSSRTTGTVSWVYEASDGTCCFSVIQFVTDEGQTIEFHTNFNGIFPNKKRGVTFPIRYDPANAERATVDTFIQAYNFPIGLLVIGDLMSTWGYFGVKHYAKQEDHSYLGGLLS